MKITISEVDLRELLQGNGRTIDGAEVCLEYASAHISFELLLARDREFVNDVKARYEKVKQTRRY